MSRALRHVYEDRSTQTYRVNKLDQAGCLPWSPAAAQHSIIVSRTNVLLGSSSKCAYSSASTLPSGGLSLPGARPGTRADSAWLACKACGTPSWSPGTGRGKTRWNFLIGPRKTMAAAEWPVVEENALAMAPQSRQRCFSSTTWRESSSTTPGERVTMRRRLLGTPLRGHTTNGPVFSLPVPLLSRTRLETRGCCSSAM